MKRLLIAALLILLAVGLFAQQGQGISNPGAKVTITHDEIIQLGRQYNHSGRNGEIVLDFEGLGNNDTIWEFYAGGTSRQGYSGTNYGIEFWGGAYSLIDADAGGSGNFANEPSPNTVMFFTNGSFVDMEVPAGITSGFSFYYTADLVRGSVEVWSGLNGTGSWLAEVHLPVNSNLNCTGDPNGDFCHWDMVNVSFAGTAKSVYFNGIENHFGIDDITIGSAGQQQVPVSTWALFLGIGLIVVVAMYRFVRISRA